MSVPSLVQTFIINNVSLENGETSSCGLGKRGRHLCNGERGAAETGSDLERARLGPEAERAADLLGDRVAAGARVSGAVHVLVLPQSARK